MRQKFAHRVIVFFLAVVMVLGNLSVTAEAASQTTTTYTARLTAPDTSNKYYYSSMNIFYACGYGMPNCTAYAYGRAYELLGTEPKLSWGSAYKWYNYNKTNGYYSYGSEPRLGAIACWYQTSSPTTGHVAVVEKINGDGTIVISESRYQKLNFTTTTINADGSGYSSKYTFQGYIYILPETVTDTDTVTSTDTVYDAEETDDSENAYTPSGITVSYRTHVQTYGWQDFVTDGTMSGTSGKSKRLEGIEIKVSGDADLGIQYTTHVQSYGWQSWSRNGELSGTEGESKRLEAIKIQLTGADKDLYDVYYRVHAQTYGWMGWAKNGEPAGTSGYSKRLEAIEIVIVKKGINPPVRSNQTTTQAYVEKTATNTTVSGTDSVNVAYRTHVQSYGWQGWKYNGQMSGTSGESKRLEGINIKLTNQLYSGSIQYMTHIQSYGWETEWKQDGALSGTSGQSKRLEAIKIQLTGEMAEKYDVYYRVHAQTYGWLGWAKNGEPAGTAGYSKRLEGIEIVLVEKGGAAPGSTDNAYISSTGQ